VTVCVYDSETELFGPARCAPPIVCISWARPGFKPDIVQAHLDSPAALELVTSWLTGNETLVGHHIVYDNAVVCAKWPQLIPLMFAKYDRDEITCTKLRQQLLDIAGGQFRGYLQHFSKEVNKADGSVEVVTGAIWRRHNYGLEDLAYRALGRRLDKAPKKKKNKDGSVPVDTSWQKRYGELIDIPISQWPEEARQYPLDDAGVTLEVYQQQEAHAEFIPDQFRQARAAWALHLTQTWGLKTHGPSVDRLERETLTALDAIEDGLKECGFVRENGVRDTKKTQAHMVAVCKAAGKPVRLTETGEKKFEEITETGQIETKKGVVRVDAEAVYEYIASAGGISLDVDACAASEDDLLEDYAERTSLTAMLNKDIPYLKEGIVYPVHTSYGLAASGRSTSCIAKGSKIQMPCHRGQYPQGKPIEEIVAGDRVYSYDLSGRLYLQKVLWAGCTGHKPVVRVSWRGHGRQHSGDLLLTAEHRVMLFEGVWKEAGDLKPGDRITALSCRPKGKGEGRYQHLYARGATMLREHVFAHEQLTGSVSESVHHRDHDKDNNELTNLQGMTATEHHQLHAREQSPETLAKKIAALLSPETRKKQIASIKRGPENPRWMEVSRKTLLRWAALSAGKIRHMMDLTGHDYEFIQTRCALHGIDLMALRKRYNLDGQYLSKYVVRLAAQLQGNARHKALKISYYRFPEMVDFWGLSNNHEVLSVEPAGFSDVYDLEVENTSAFIANELCVHNSKPNVQNPKRSGDVYRNGKIKYTLPDVRECWMPREGMIFAQADFEQLELCTLGQTCITLFGHSALADAINSGIDPHTDFACSILGIPYEVGMKRKKDKTDKEFENARQTSKVANFGHPGGLGAATLCMFARKSYNVKLKPDREEGDPEFPPSAKELKAMWMDHWPEMKEFFAHVGNLIDKDTGDGVLQQLFSERWRGGCHYTSACNSFFQGLGADAAKRALYLVVRACYAEPDSVLYGSRPVLFCHDEVVMEVLDDEFAHDKAVEMARLMIAGANEFLPDVPAKTDPILGTRWSKKMQAIFGADKRLRAWSPEIMQAWNKGEIVLYDGKGRQMIPEASETAAA
jgi:hypothetical protein